MRRPDGLPTIEEMLQDEDLGFPISSAEIEVRVPNGTYQGSVKLGVTEDPNDPKKYGVTDNVKRLSLHTFGPLVMLNVQPHGDEQNYFVPIHKVFQVS